MDVLVFVQSPRIIILLSMQSRSNLVSIVLELLLHSIQIEVRIVLLGRFGDLVEGIVDMVWAQFLFHVGEYQDVVFDTL